MLALIFLNTVQLAMYDPFDIPALKPISPNRDAMDIIGRYDLYCWLSDWCASRLCEKSACTQCYALLILSVLTIFLPLSTSIWFRIFSGLFLAECVLKIFALGFILGPHTYLQDSWNYLDLVVVIIGVLDFFPSDQGSNQILMHFPVYSRYPGHVHDQTKLETVICCVSLSDGIVMTCCL